jgi:hypothetical protein
MLTRLTVYSESMSASKVSRTNQLYLSGGLVLAAMIGMSIPITLVWAGLWIWNRDFVRMLGAGYVKSVMLGLAAASIFQYWGGALINLPTGFTSGAIVAVGVAFGLKAERRGRRGY